MVISEADLRDALRPPTRGAQISVPAGAQLTPSARDFVKQWQLELIPTAGRDEAGVSSPLGAAALDPSGVAVRAEDAPSRRPAFQKDSVFPVVLSGPVPRCTSCGSEVRNKPDNLTQLNAHHFVEKNHPRIRLRGQVDSLHAFVLLTESMARAAGVSWLGDDLATLASYCRELTSAEYNERPVADLELSNCDMEELHKITHDPKGTLGIEHLTIDGFSPQLIHWLNICRTQSRELELTALDAFSSPHHPCGSSINHGLNRLSSAFYYLQLRLEKEQRDESDRKK